ncbi:hypothetical protein [Streptomyces sp. NPDC092295]|uniref:hypothetical protein n=1 Tax=Streptomyces sp. NPDC092295 TaxID=3366011 RepID=UPI0037FC3306
MPGWGWIEEGEHISAEARSLRGAAGVAERRERYAMAILDSGVPSATGYREAEAAMAVADEEIRHARFAADHGRQVIRNLHAALREAMAHLGECV